LQQFQEDAQASLNQQIGAISRELQGVREDLERRENQVKSLDEEKRQVQEQLMELMNQSSVH
jgi:archaellum component FlaC